MDLLSAGFPVPEGVVIRTEAYESFLDRNGLRPRIEGTLDDLDYGDAVKVLCCAESIRYWVMAGEMDPKMSDRLLKETGGLGPDGLWAVRSSAIAEDLEEASFAGQ